MNSNYEIKIDIGKLLYYSEALKPQISNETLVMMIRSFSSYLKILYETSIRDEIYSRKYKGAWEPVEDPEYLEYIGTTPSYHILDLISDALEIREIKDKVVIRIDPTYLYPGSKRTLIQVLKAIDNGTSKFNARPILKKLVRQVNVNIPRLWTRYLKLKGVA